ncbi:MAG: hypothetical protein IKD55_01055 [Sediminibacterium sp.]|nr:hypothetical protein [Sediminibacterium sp.]
MYDKGHKLSNDEMKSVIAGTDLTPVEVSSSYSRVYGMNYNSWYMLNMGFLTYTLGGSGSSSGSEGQGKTLEGELFQGGSGYMSAEMTALRNDLLNLATAVGLGAGAIEIVNLSVEALFSDPINQQIISRIGTTVGILGVVTNGISIVTKLNSVGWDFSQLSAADWVDLSFLTIGAITLAIPLLLPGVTISAGAGLAIGVTSLGWSIYRAANPQ